MPVQLEITTPDGKHTSQRVIMPGQHECVPDFSSGAPEILVVRCEDDDSGQQVFRITERHGIRLNPDNEIVVEGIINLDETNLEWGASAGNHQDSVYAESIAKLSGDNLNVRSTYLGGLATYYTRRDS